MAVFLLWPLMTWFTKRDWQGMENLNADAGGIIVAGNHLWFDPRHLARTVGERSSPRF